MNDSIVFENLYFASAFVVVEHKGETLKLFHNKGPSVLPLGRDYLGADVVVDVDSDSRVISSDLVDTVRIGSFNRIDDATLDVLIFDVL